MRIDGGDSIMKKKHSRKVFKINILLYVLHDRRVGAELLRGFCDWGSASTFLLSTSVYAFTFHHSSPCQDAAGNDSASFHASSCDL